MLDDIGWIRVSKDDWDTETLITDAHVKAFSKALTVLQAFLRGEADILYGKEEQDT